MSKTELLLRSLPKTELLLRSFSKTELLLRSLSKTELLLRSLSKTELLLRSGSGFSYKGRLRGSATHEQVLQMLTEVSPSFRYQTCRFLKLLGFRGLRTWTQYTTS